MNSMFVLMDVLVAGCGIYILYAYILLTKKGEVKETLLLPADIKMSQCKDKEGYMAYIAPRLLAFGICALLCGGIGVVNDYTKFIGRAYIAITAVFLVLLIWFALSLKKSITMFW